MTQVMYIGPNSKKLGLTRNTVYEDGLPYNVREAIKICPEVERVIVGIDELDDKWARIRRKGTPEFRAYEVIAELR